MPTTPLPSPSPWPEPSPLPHHPTTVHALVAAAESETELGVTVVAERAGQPAEHRSYRRLLEDARRMATAYRELGVRRGDRVLLVLPTGFDFVAAFFGAQLIGAIPAPAYPPAGSRLDSGLDRLAHIATRADARLCVTWGEARRVLGDLALRAPCLARIATAEEMRQHPPAQPVTLPTPDDVAFIQYTSGSTGRPKGVTLAHRNVVANMHAIGLAARIRQTDKMAGWLPLYHDMGLVGQLLWPIYWRIAAVLMSPMSFLSRPRRWLQMIDRHQATLSQAPNFGYALATRRIDPKHRADIDLSALRIVLCGAETIHAETVREFARAFAPCGLRAEAVLPVYGLAECTVAVAFDAPEQPPTFEDLSRAALARGVAEPCDDASESLTLTSVGSALPGHRIRILGDDGSELPDRRIGQVAVAGPSVMLGYDDDPEATAAALHDGWLLTGDLGYRANGHLFIAGRAKDVIIIAGENYYAEDLEAAAETVAEIRRGSAVAFAVHDDRRGTETAVLVCESRCGDDQRAALADAVRERVLGRCQVSVSTVAIVAPGTVPKTSSGKRQRNECRARYLEGRLARTDTGRLGLGLTLLRSQAGYLTMAARRLTRR